MYEDYYGPGQDQEYDDPEEDGMDYSPYDDEDEEQE